MHFLPPSPSPPPGSSPTTANTKRMLHCRSPRRTRGRRSAPRCIYRTPHPDLPKPLLQIRLRQPPISAHASVENTSFFQILPYIIQTQWFSSSGSFVTQFQYSCSEHQILTTIRSPCRVAAECVSGRALDQSNLRTARGSSKGV